MITFILGTAALVIANLWVSVAARRSGLDRLSDGHLAH